MLGFGRGGWGGVGVLHVQGVSERQKTLARPLARVQDRSAKPRSHHLAGARVIAMSLFEGFFSQWPEVLGDRRASPTILTVLL